MEPWMKHTDAANTIAKIAAYRLAPCATNLAAVPPCLRPTQMQIFVSHPPVIDWCVFPFLRDKLIHYHCFDPMLDEICGHVGMAYVVEADLSDLVTGVDPMRVYFSIFDITYSMENNPSILDGIFAPSITHGEDGKSPARLPAPSLEVLLHTKEYAWELFKYFGIDKDYSTYRLDASLFSRYPHLWEESAPVAGGIPLRARENASWPTPRPLDDKAIRYYSTHANIIEVS
jgi:hypothetical protein